MQHCEWQLFLLKENDKIIGRIAAFIDTLAIDFWKERIGFFGYFECIDNKEASELLLNEVKAGYKRKLHGHAWTMDFCSSRMGNGY